MEQTIRLKAKYNYHFILLLQWGLLKILNYLMFTAYQHITVLY